MPMMISAQTARRAVWRPLWQLPQRFDLILSLTKRELAARYRGSALGVAWAVLTPTVMIAIFTIIFAGIFKARFGAAWLLASLGVFVRDIVQGITLFLLAWMYLTPIIYPESLVPERYQGIVNLNPFTPLVRNYRRIILEGMFPDWRGLGYFAAFALVSFFLGYWWFARTRKNFADVI